ncbi:MAG: 4-(cytidine 5'-diphospho)-2-C-methyl-D-erythritol kinase [Planctomycetales bacterium]|nr:4-(cytidine 5'-diphospho)-2-C-methyl-D-erythritol kinase [Planctomycetales bacterium]
MLIERQADWVRIEAPAKINLFLEVLGKRPDGFHEVETLLCPISLFDTLQLRPTEDPAIRLHVRTPAASDAPLGDGDLAWQVPSDERNLVRRAVRLVQQHLGESRGCELLLEKRIPAAAGLGGGSSDAAAAVVASLLAWGQWDRPLATQICATLGSDVPFFLGAPQGIGLALARGRGERCQPLSLRPELSFVVTHPPVGCPTAAVFREFVAVGKVRQFQDFVVACETGQLQKIGAALFNALQSPASRLTDWIERQLHLFADCGANHGLMCGSGSSCFALIEEPEVADRIRQAAEATGLTRIYSVRAWYGNSIEQQLETQVG